MRWPRWWPRWWVESSLASAFVALTAFAWWAAWVGTHAPGRCVESRATGDTVTLAGGTRYALRDCVRRAPGTPIVPWQP